MDTVYVAVAGMIPHKVEGVNDGAILYLQPDGKMSNNSSHVVSKEIGVQSPNGVIVDIKKETSINNVYTSYQDNTGLRKLDAVRITETGNLIKSLNTELETSEVFGVVAKLETGLVQCVTSGFIESNQEIADGTLLFLQADGSIGPNSVGIVEKAIAIKVPRGIYVDIKLGVEKKELQKGSISSTVRTTKDTSLVHISSTEVFEKGTHIGIGQDGEYQVYAAGLTYVGMIQKAFFNTTLNTYVLITSGFVPYSDVSLTNYTNLYGCTVNVADQLFYHNGNGITNFNNLNGEVKLGTFLKEGLLLEHKEVKAATVEPVSIMTSVPEVKTEYKLERRKFYEGTTLSLTIEELVFFETKNYSKVVLINNSGNLFAELQSGKLNVRVHKYQGKFIIQPLTDLKISTELELKEIKYSDDFISLQI